MVSEEKLANGFLEEARDRQEPFTPCEVHPIRLLTLVAAGGKIVEENKPLRDESTGRFSGYRSEVEYGDEEGKIIFYCETAKEIKF